MGARKRKVKQAMDWPVPPPLTFVVAGRPQPKQRARKGRGGHWYTPDETKRFEQAVAEMAMVAHRSAVHSEPMTHPGWPTNARYAVQVIVVFEAGQRADLDNVVKSVLDGLNGVLWVDDSQVAAITTSLGSRIVGPCTAITVTVDSPEQWQEEA